MRWFLVLFLIVPGHVLAQAPSNGDEKRLGILPLRDGKVTYVDVIQVDSAEASILYKKARRWFVDKYRSGKDVIQLDDKENAEVVGRGLFKELWWVTFYSTQEIDVWHTVSIQCRDGRFRYEIGDFRVEYYSAATQYSGAYDVDQPLEDWPATSGKNAQKIAKQIHDHVMGIILSLKEAMRSPLEDDW